ncbi:MAG TPA: GNAT family N-acetyltransferase [Flavisolibacter sp.]|nr:GNAT family N-acetyltransferase [Flavisolibacter sp.]
MKADSLSIEPCTEADIPEISRIGYASYVPNYMYLWQAEKYGHWYMDLSFSEDSLRKQFEMSGAAFYLIYEDEIPVGMVKTVRGISVDGKEVNESIELEKIYILKEYAAKGIGSKVMTLLIADAKRSGCTKIWLKSMDSSKSVTFYQKNGFEIIGHERLPYEGFKEEYRNMVILERPI